MLEQIAQVFGIVEAIAVVVSLIAIFMQVRQTRRLAESSAYQSLFDSYNQLMVAIAQDKELSVIFKKGRTTPDKLSKSDKARFFFLCVQWFDFHENLYIQYRNGVLPARLYDGWQQALKNNLPLPGFMSYWNEEKDEYTSSFREYIDSLLNEVGKTDSTAILEGN